MYDIIVVGGGPIGAYTAYQLARDGFYVALFDEHKEIGTDIVCTGIVGVEAFERFHLPKEAIVGKIDSVLFFSPSLSTLKYQSPNAFAYVVDRSIFDKCIIEYAKNNGVDIQLGKRVEKAEIHSDFVRVEFLDTRNLNESKCKVLILATGTDYKLHRHLGLSCPPYFLYGMQMEAQTADLLITPEIYFNHLSPGSFAWVVPFRNHIAKIGALTKGREICEFKKFIHLQLEKRVKNYSKIAQKLIAHGAAEQSVNDRVIAVGEAAGQVKTTTGGGIFYGLLCSEIAVEIVKKAFNNGDWSKRQFYNYEKLWRAKIGKELETGLKVRKFVESMRGSQIESIFRLIQTNKELQKLIKKKINFEYHSDILSFALNFLSSF